MQESTLVSQVDRVFERISADLETSKQRKISDESVDELSAYLQQLETALNVRNHESTLFTNKTADLEAEVSVIQEKLLKSTEEAKKLSESLADLRRIQKNAASYFSVETVDIHGQKLEINLKIDAEELKSEIEKVNAEKLELRTNLDELRGELAAQHEQLSNVNQSIVKYFEMLNNRNDLENKRKDSQKEPEPSRNHRSGRNGGKSFKYGNSRNNDRRNGPNNSRKDQKIGNSNGESAEKVSGEDPQPAKQTFPKSEFRHDARAYNRRRY